jgi:glucose/arabinose dehydrogenase
MRGFRPILTPVLLAGSLLAAGRAWPQAVPTDFADSLVAGALDLPCAIEFAPGNRVLVTEQLSARVLLVHPGPAAIVDTVLVVPGVVAGGERGLLGVALDPRFPASPYLYTHQTSSGNVIRISRWTLGGDLAGTGNGKLTANPASRYDLVANAPDNAGNHNGGTVRFGPDGMLYVSLGEDAVDCAAQDLTSLRGKMLRLDVTRLPAGPGSAPRILVAPPDNPYAASPDSNAKLVYAYGLRNPFRFQVDAVRRWLVIADVGQGRYEEVDLLALGGGSGTAVAPAGANFGWPWLEGNAAYGSCTGSMPPTSAPAYVFDRTALAGAALISAGAYHAPAGATLAWPAEYEGDLFISEFYTGPLQRLKLQAGSWSPAPPVPGQPSATEWGTGYANVSDYRVGPDGSLWYCMQSTTSYLNTGTIGKIAYTAGSTSVGHAPPPLGMSAWPLPAPGSVSFALRLPAAALVTLELYDVRGRLVRTLLPAQARGAGTASLTWDGRDDAGRALRAGLYWARLRSGAAAVNARVILVR